MATMQCVTSSEKRLGVSEKALDAKMEGLEMVSCPLDPMYVV